MRAHARACVCVTRLINGNPLRRLNPLTLMSLPVVLTLETSRGRGKGEQHGCRPGHGTRVNIKDCGLFQAQYSYHWSEQYI